ncbi:unnamed protein product, partial [Sphacelaria rigidula]
KLNKLPQVKKFLKDPEHALSYENVTVDFVRGKPPVLFIYDADSDEVEEKISVEKMTIIEVRVIL